VICMVKEAQNSRTRYMFVIHWSASRWIRYLGFPKTVRCCVAAEARIGSQYFLLDVMMWLSQSSDRKSFGFDSLARVRDTDGLDLYSFAKGTEYMRTTTRTGSQRNQWKRARHQDQAKRRGKEKRTKKTKIADG
jgi:hypothetical protein